MSNELEQFKHSCITMNLEKVKYWIDVKGYSVNTEFILEKEDGKLEERWTPICLVIYRYDSRRFRDWCVPYLIEKGADLSVHPNCFHPIDHIAFEIMYFPMNALPLLLMHGGIISNDTFSMLILSYVPDLIPLVSPCYTKKMFHCSILSGYYGTKYVEECINHLSSHDHNPYAHGLTFFQFACYLFSNEIDMNEEYEENDRYARIFCDLDNGVEKSIHDEPPRYKVSTYPLTLHDEFLPKRIEIMVKTHGIRPIHDKKIDPLLIILQSTKSCSNLVHILWNNGYKEYFEQTPEFKQLVQEVSHTNLLE